MASQKVLVYLRFGFMHTILVLIAIFSSLASVGPAFADPAPHPSDVQATAPEESTSEKSGPISPDDILAPPREPGKIENELLATRSFEDGVVDRLVLDYFGRYRLGRLFALETGLSASFFGQGGLDLIGLSGVARFPNARSELVLGAQHESWPDWFVSENRFELYWRFHPLDRFEIDIGGAYRTPVFDSSTLAQWFSWWGPDAEVSILYRFDWKFMVVGRHTLGFAIFNYDRMRLDTPDDVHFMAEYGYRWKPNVRLVGFAGTASKGVSGGVVSWGQSWLTFGAQYDL